ncbi:MAG: efflux RND transporter permease subunit, partial [Phycisphaerales bacterium JB039]
MFSRIFIHRPIFASVISIVITLVGALALLALPIARYPEVAPPTVQVSANYPGANAETVAETVAAPIEREVNGVEGMAYMTSVSAADGSMTLTVTFEVGTDIDMANVLVQNRVAIAQPRLPPEVTRQGVTVKKKASDTTLFLALTSPEGSRDAVFLSNYATLFLKDELARIDGVGDVFIYGVGDYSMRIWLDPDRLLAVGLTTNDVVNAIREQNVQVAAGQIGAPPAPDGTAFQFTINTRGRLADPEGFESIIVRSGDRGRIVRVRDVGRVEIGSQTYNVYSQLNGKPAATLAISQLPGANAIDIVDNVRRKLDELAENFPDDVAYEVPYDATLVIRASIDEVITTLFITLVLVVLTVYIFLQSVRATLIPALTIPVSLVGTFAVMAALGYSINLLTLFGLVLVIGIVVDDAIVVVENVTRHLDEGETDPKKATEKAMAEVTGPVIATTLVLLAVFVPTIFLGGITGQLFRQFAITISIATVFSSINALTLSPALCGVLLRPTTKRPLLPFRIFNSALDWTTRGYLGIVRGAVRLAAVGVVVFMGVVVGAIWLFGQIPSAFIPFEDEGWMMVNVRLPDGASLQRTEQTLEGVTRTLGEIPGVADVLTIGGYSLLDGAMSSNAGSFIVTLEPWDQRPASEHQFAILAQISEKLADVRTAVAVAFPPPSLPGLGMAGGFSMQIQDRGALGLPALEQVAREFVEDGETQSALTGLYTGFSTRTPQLFIDIDRDQVKSMGIPLQEVFDTLQAYLGSAYVNDFTYFNRTYQVKVQADAAFRATPEDIEKLEVRGPSGRMIPLGTFVSVEHILGPQIVTRHNVYPAAKVSGRTTMGTSSGEGMEVLSSMARQKLPPAMGYAWTDMSYQEAAAAG